MSTPVSRTSGAHAVPKDKIELLRVGASNFLSEFRSDSECSLSPVLMGFLYFGGSPTHPVVIR
jgi:hypothetical protein